MNSLLQPDRLTRLIEQSTVDGVGVYTAAQFFTDLRRRHLGGAGDAGEADRSVPAERAADLSRCAGRAPERPGPPPEVRSLLRGELRAVRADIVRAMPAVTDRLSRLHLEDARDQIDEILDPRAMRDSAGGGGGRGGIIIIGGAPSWKFDWNNDPFLKTAEICWPDYSVN